MKTPTKTKSEPVSASPATSTSTASTTSTAPSKSKNGLPMPINVQAVMTEHKTKSAAIRYLSSLQGETGVGYTRSEIADAMEIRYQHVRNVLTQKLKKSDATPTSSTASIAPASNVEPTKSTALAANVATAKSSKSAKAA